MNVMTNTEATEESLLKVVEGVPRVTHSGIIMVDGEPHFCGFFSGVSEKADFIMPVSYILNMLENGVYIPEVGQVSIKSH